VIPYGTITCPWVSIRWLPLTSAKIGLDGSGAEHWELDVVLGDVVGDPLVDVGGDLRVEVL
jgi:hypothetical protein